MKLHRTNNTIMRYINKIRTKLIIWLAGDSPVVLGVIISRPPGCEWPLLTWRDNSKFGLVYNCVLMGQLWTAGLIVPKRDYAYWQDKI